MQAQIERAQTDCYPDFQNFTNKEVNTFIGMLIANGPKPQMNFWFQQNREDSNLEMIHLQENSMIKAHIHQ